MPEKFVLQTWAAENVSSENARNLEEETMILVSEYAKHAEYLQTIQILKISDTLFVLPLLQQKVQVLEQLF